MLRTKEIIEGFTCPEDRCLGTTLQHKQCPHKKVEGFDFCPMHLTAGERDRARKDKMYEFARSQYMDRLAKRIPSFSKGAAKFDMAQEIGILRIQLEETLNQCTSDIEFLRNNQKISNTIEQIRRTIESSLKLDQKLGSLMSRDDVIGIAQKLVASIEVHVKDPTIIHAIVSDFEKILTEATAPKPE